jgi:glycopeptide antibiotics resistance protein
VPTTHRHPRLATILSARVAYVLIIFIATLTNLEPNWHDGLAMHRLARAINPPLRWSDTIDAIRNILLFAGFGAIWEVTSRLRLRTALGRATFYGFLLSATVETLQLFSPARFSSILDIITNTGGTFIGAFVVAGLVASVRARRDHTSYLGVPAFLLALGLLGAVAMEGATPLFRQTYAPGTTGGPLHRLHLTLGTAEPFSIGMVPASDFGLSIPAGCLTVAALMEFGISRVAATIAVALVGSAVAFASEIAHGTTGEVVVWAAAAAHALGLIVGALIAAVFLPRIVRRFTGVTRIRIFIAAYAVVLIGWLWRPFRPLVSSVQLAQQLSLPHWIPMTAFGRSGSVFAVGQIIQLFFLFLPLGALLEAWPARESGWMRWLMPGVWLALFIAAGQIFIAARTFDVSNFLIMIAGVWMGWWIARRAGVPRCGTWLTS